jgi:hypothetical protein
VLSTPIVIHLHRPYGSEEEYIAHEHFSIEAKSMLLIDQPALPLDTAVVFDVTLENGQKPIRAEARVIGHVEPEGERPGGLRVRFRRFGAATKAFIDRAVNHTPAADSAPVNSVAPVVDSGPRASIAPVVDSGPLASIAPVVDSAPSAAPPVDACPALAIGAAAMHAATPLHSGQPSEADETSGIHKKTCVPAVAAPPDREALLARLRGRRVS